MGACIRRLLSLGLGWWCLLVGGCGLFGKSAEPSPSIETASANAGAWPETPISAFRPATAGACPPGFTLSQTTCVHEAYRSRVGPLELEKSLAEYRAGAAAPKVGGGPAQPAQDEEIAVEPKDPSKIPPGALATKRRNADEAKAKRLAELELLIRNAKIRAGERVDPHPTYGPAALEFDPLNPNARPPATAEPRIGEDAMKLQEMTQGLPPDVLKAVLVEIQRNGGTEMVSLDELTQLQAQIKAAEAELQK